MGVEHKATRGAASSDDWEESGQQREEVKLVLSKRMLTSSTLLYCSEWATVSST